MTQTWSANRRAAKAVALNARDTAEARQLLEMIGLVEPGGHEVLPDDPRNYDTGFNAAVPGHDRDASPVVLSAAAERGDRMTTPTGLRAVPSVATPVKPVKKRRTLTDDLAELEATDPVVASAAASYDRMVERITNKPLPAAALPQPTSEVPVPEPAPPSDRYKHGTRGGYQGHRRRGEDACEACKAANRDDQRAQKARRWADAMDRAEATIARIEQATEEAVPPVSPIAEPEADQLADWELELLKENGGRAAGLATAAYGAEEATMSAVELDVWLAAAALSSSKPVQRAARAASSALLQLHSALDELARAERAATRSPVAR